jgi:hypothetical protein
MISFVQRKIEQNESNTISSAQIVLMRTELLSADEQMREPRAMKYHQRHMKFTATRVLMLALTAVTALGGLAAARGGFDGVAYRVMKLERVPKSELAQSQCLMCHEKMNGGPPWNSFGWAVGFWRGKKQNVPDALYSAIRYGGDTDRDGYPDVLERLANTKPDDRDDKPSEPLEVLKKRFDADFKLEADSDLDGYANALEVLAGTLPGEAASKPSQTVEALQTQLQALGGIEYFLAAR